MVDCAGLQSGFCAYTGGTSIDCLPVRCFEVQPLVTLNRRRICLPDAGKSCVKKIRERVGSKNGMILKVAAVDLE